MPDLFVLGTETSSIPTSVDVGRLSSESPLDHFRFCCNLLNDARHPTDVSKIIRFYEMAMADPMGKNYQPSMAALALIARLMGKNHENITPQLFPSNAPMGTIGARRQADRLLPVPIARRLVQMWDELGLLKSAEDARNWLCSVGHSRYLFFREGDFKDLEVCAFDSRSNGMDAHLGIARIATEPVDACLTISGWNTGLGVMRFHSVEIPSFGPHRFPLSDLNGFGIAQIGAHRAEIAADPELLSLNGWTRCYGHKDIWMQVQARATIQGADVNVRWVGIEPQTSGPFFMVFYVKADSCQLEDGTQIQPRSMQKYEGTSQKIILNQSVQIECSEMLNMQVIPLAGSGCFWNSTFLVAFEFTSSQNQASYLFRIL
ncbi:MAG: hypothetical protein HW387_217 [Parachlamydiales bacterium]|nr:hypothetical protein [Parachlamydiales bacterium]